MHAQFARIHSAFDEKFPQVAAHLDEARADVLAFTALAHRAPRARQAAQAERLDYQRRGGLVRLAPRGGVFPQKISNSERTLLILLYLCKQATLDALDEALGDVSRSLIGAVVRETRPCSNETATWQPRRSSLPHRRRTAR